MDIDVFMEKTLVTIPQSGFTPFSDYLITGQSGKLERWLSTEQGQSYLNDLYSNLSTGSTTLYRGLTKTAESISDINFKSGSFVSFTQSPDVAEEFAIDKGSNQMIKANIDHSTIVFHYNYIEPESLGPFPLNFEEEIICKWSDKNKLIELIDLQ